MARTTRSDDDTSPRPIGQSFWLFATMVIAVVIVGTMGDALTTARGASGQRGYSSQQLLELASPTTAASGTASPDVSSETSSWQTSPTTGLTAPTITASQTPTPGGPDAVSDADGSNGSAATGADDPTGNAGAGSDPNSTGHNHSHGETGSDHDATDQADVDQAGGDQTTGDQTSIDAGPDSSNSATIDPLDHNARGQAALATISYPWQDLLPGWTITFLPEKAGLYGLTKVPDERIEIYVRENQSLALLAHVIAHELGHAVDVTLNDGPDRRLWEDARGLESSPWWPGSGATDFSTGAGDFAESFAAWQVGDQSFRSELAGAPTAAQIELLAQLSAG